MSKLKIKSLAVLAATLILIAGTTGCGEKQIDYNEEGENLGIDDNSNSISTTYGIPEECNAAIDVGNSGLEEITVYNTEVKIPDTSEMAVSYFMLKEYTNETKQEIAEALFDKEEGIYNCGVSTKDDIQEMINDDEEWLQECVEIGDETEASYLTEEIEELESELANAPDNYPAVDYSNNFFQGTLNDREYMLFLDSKSSYFSICDAYEYRAAYDTQGAGECLFGSSEFLETEGLENMCTLTEDEAQNMAWEFIETLGMDNMILEETYELYWKYYNSHIDDYNIDTQLDGYVFNYVMEVNNTPVSTECIGFADNLCMDNINIDVPTEEITIFIDSNGVVYAYWTDYMDATGETETNVELLSFDDMLEKANQTVSEYYTQYPTNYSKIEFNDIELTYFLSETDEEGVFKYVPAWILSEYEKGSGSFDEDNPIQVVVINAVDGSVIDIVSLTKSLGTYQEYVD